MSLTLLSIKGRIAVFIYASPRGDIQPGANVSVRGAVKSWGVRLGKLGAELVIVRPANVKVDR